MALPEIASNAIQHLKEYTYKNTGGTGKFEKAGGGGTYTLEELTDTLLGGKYKGTIELP